MVLFHRFNYQAERTAFSVAKRASKVFKYRSFDDDVVFTKNQNATIPDDYIWLHQNWFYRMIATVVYVIAVVVSNVYCRLFLRTSFRNKQCLSTQGKRGAFIYGNHTQPLGDALLPMLVAIPRRAYPIAEPANLGIPMIGRLLTMGGALILPAKLSQMVQFQRAMNHRLNQHQRIFIYPEAHVWPYYTKIRPFPVGAFHYPVAANLPSYCMTITYQKSRWFHRPKQVVYFDGPFMPDQTLPRKQRQQKLHDQIHAQMVVRSRQSNVSYMTYQQQTH
ncbi:1-acyl-sn-glycerol-3-phosphate acyltransferase [Lentilactobacillus parakefiri DSM 10551]|nr:1-acyl-sn-glycerol-3-phosphate acyltransferase [Lentilactobacillus parakefiri DSM 10551]